MTAPWMSFLSLTGTLNSWNCITSTACSSQSISTASIVYIVHKAWLWFEFWGGLLNLKIAAEPHWDCKWDLNLSNSIKCKVPGPLQFSLLTVLTDPTLIGMRCWCFVIFTKNQKIKTLPFRWLNHLTVLWVFQIKDFN